MQQPKRSLGNIVRRFYIKLNRMLEILKELDQNLLLLINGAHSPFLDGFMWLVSAKLTWVVMYASIIYVLIKNLNLRLTIFTVIAIALVITYCDQMCATVLRPIFERLRPANLENPFSEYVRIINNYRGGRYGFPSCHAANSFGLAFFLVFLFKQRKVSMFILLWAALVSYSRSYLGVHYPGDLLFGAFIGFTGAAIVYVIYRILLNIHGIAKALDFFQKDKILILKPARMKYTSTLIIVGILSILAFAIYSCCWY